MKILKLKNKFKNVHTNVYLPDLDPLAIYSYNFEEDDKR